MAYALPNVAPFVRDVAERVGPMFDISTVYGWRATSVDMTGHPAGLALDLIVGTDKAKGDKLATYLVNNAAALNVKYLIWQQRSWYPGKGWQGMAYRPGTAPGYDPNHMHHVHASFSPDVKDGRRLSTSSGGLGGGMSVGADLSGIKLPDLSNPFDGAKALFQRETWMRVAYVVGGGGMIVAGLAILITSSAADVAGSPAGKTALAAAGPQGKAASVALSMKG